MKKFILKFIIYLFIILSGTSAITWIVNKGLLKSDFENIGDWKAIFGGDIQAETIIQGSSRAWVQYNTQIIDSLLKTNSYNLGMDGAPFHLQYIRYKTYLKHNKKPRLIIQNVDTDLLERNTAVFQKFQFYPFLYDKEFKNLLYEQHMLDFSDYYLPPLRYYGQPKAMQIALEELTGIHHYTSSKTKGYAGVTKKWDDGNLKIKIHDEYQWKTDPETEQQFFNFLNECKEENIEVVLVYAPVYQGLYKLSGSYREAEIYFKKIAEKYHIRFLNFCQHPVSYKTDNFYNASHLNKKGAELFTSELGKSLKLQ